MTTLSSDELVIPDRGYVIEASGLRILRELSRTEWADLGKLIRGRIEGGKWALADWLVYGEGRGEGGNRWTGSSYKLASELTGYSVPVLSAAYAVGKAFPPDRREQPLLVWSVYERIAQQPEHERADLLRLARQGLTTREVEDHITKARDARQAEIDKAVAAVTSNYRGRAAKKTVRKVQCPQCAHVFPVMGHIVSD